MSTNTGSQAFPGPHWSEGETGMTLLDWMAGQALVAIPHIGCGYGLETGEIAHEAYNIAAAMLAEKARREADHSVDANKMVQDHSPDAGKMAALEAENRELLEVLGELLDCISETRGKNASDAVMNAVAILAKHKEAA